jgi:hypothetical protein
LIGGKEVAMNLTLNADESALLKVLLLAELEDKRVEMHHTKNVEFKSELLSREKLIQGILARL